MIVGDRVMRETAVSGFALRMRRHMEIYGTTLEQIAKVANLEAGVSAVYILKK